MLVELIDAMLCEANDVVPTSPGILTSILSEGTTNSSTASLLHDTPRPTIATASVVNKLYIILFISLYFNILMKLNFNNFEVNAKLIAERKV